MNTRPVARFPAFGRSAFFVLASIALATAHPVTELPKLIQSGLPLRDLGAVNGADVMYRFDVPPGATAVSIKTSGGRGDCDLFVRQGAYPTINNYDEASANFGPREKITISKPLEGVWYVLVRATAAYSGVGLTVRYEQAKTAAALPILIPGPGDYTGSATVQLRSSNVRSVIRYTLDGSDPDANSPRFSTPVRLTASATVKAKAFLPNGTTSPIAEGSYEIQPNGTLTSLVSGEAATHLAGMIGSSALFKISVPDGHNKLRIFTGGGRGDTEIFVRKGDIPTPLAYDRKKNLPRNLARVEIDTTGAHDWYILLRGRSNFSGVFILANVVSSGPDLVVWSDTLEPYITDDEVFSPGDCEVVEGMISAGPHRLLRFSTESRNIGGSDMQLGKPSEHPDWFEYARCHDHYHFLGFAAYRLVDAGGQTVATGRKVSFCLEDVVPWDLDASGKSKYDCDNQGIQNGWSDIYDAGLPGQWIDITSVPPGNYTLEVTINPEHLLHEANYDNNTTEIPVEIPPAPGVLRAGAMR